MGVLQAEGTKSAKALRLDQACWVCRAAGRTVRLEQGVEGTGGWVFSSRGTASGESLKPFPMGGATREWMS